MELSQQKNKTTINKNNTEKMDQDKTRLEAVQALSREYLDQRAKPLADIASEAEKIFEAINHNYNGRIVELEEIDDEENLEYWDMHEESGLTPEDLNEETDINTLLLALEEVNPLELRLQAIYILGSVAPHLASGYLWDPEELIRHEAEWILNSAALEQQLDDINK